MAMELGEAIGLTVIVVVVVLLALGYSPISIAVSIIGGVLTSLFDAIVGGIADTLSPL